MTRFTLSVLPSSKTGESFYDVYDEQNKITVLVLTNKAKALQVLKKLNNGDMSMLYELSLKSMK